MRTSSTSYEERLTAEAAATNSASTTPRQGWLSIGLALLAVYIIWGSTYLAIRWAVQGLPPFFMAGARFLIAGALLFVFLRLRGTPLPRSKEWGGAALVGVLLLVGGNGLVALAEQWVVSSVAALAIATTPLWAVLFARIWGRWPRRLEWLGLALGFLGIILLNLGSTLHANLLGTALLLLAAGSWALGSVWSQHLPLPASGPMSSAVEMLTAGVVLPILGLAHGEHLTWPAPAASLWALVYLIVFGSLVAFSAYVYLLRHVRPSLATSYAYVNPLVAVILGASLAGEAITWQVLAALLFILTGVVLVALGRGK